MHRERLVVCIHRKGIGTTPNLLRRNGRPFGEQITQALTIGNLLHHGHHRLRVAESQFQTISVIRGEQSILKTLHRKATTIPAEMVSSP